MAASAFSPGASMPGLNLRYDADDLVSFSILDTGVYSNSGQPNVTYWVNSTGRKIKIVGSTLGIWADYGLRADMLVAVWRDADNVLIHALGWDHYNEPTAPLQTETRWYHPYGWYLYPGDRLRIEYYFNAFGGNLIGASNNGVIYVPAGD